MILTIEALRDYKNYRTGETYLEDERIAIELINYGVAKISHRAIGDIDINYQTGNYALILSDVNKLILIDNTQAQSLFVPNNEDVVIPIGSQISVCGIGAGKITINANNGVTIRSADAKLDLRVQYSIATLIKIAINTWLLTGDTA